MAKRGEVMSEETRRKIGDAQRGGRNHMYGRTGVNNPTTGMIRSEETRIKISIAKKGVPNANKGKKHSEETRQKFSESHMGNRPSEATRQKMSVSRKGKKHSEEWNINIKISQMKPEVRKKHRDDSTGDKNPMWKGGVTKLSRRIRVLPQSSEWVLGVFTRDVFTCKGCNKTGGDLECHHIVPFSQIMIEENITSVDQAIGCSRLWEVSNGMTLCKKCHKQLHGGKYGCRS